jgi:Uma2 family endonuclease
MTTSRASTKPPRVWDDPRIRLPDAEAWAALDEAAQDAHVEAIVAVLDEYREAMSEGTRHVRRKVGAAADLDAHFRRAARGVYIGMELAVFYPGEAVIVPDVLAVMDCDPDYEPESWIVTREGRGIDVVIEVRNLGKKHKDLVENVEDYARLRIPEYFSFDCRSGQLRGWRLPDAQSRVYIPLIPQGGLLHSAMLGLDMAVVRTRLRFFSNGAMVPSESELVTRLQALVDERQSERDEAARARDEAARARDEAARARDEAARARDEADARAARFQATLAQAILQTLSLRGVSLDPRQAARVLSEDDPAALAVWAQRAFTVSSGDALLAD